MDRQFACYCGNYCKNCAVMAKVALTAKMLHEEMKKAVFEDFIQYIPDGNAFCNS